MARKIREASAVPISPLEELRRAFNVEAKESDFTVQPKSPIPLFPPGLGVEQVRYACSFNLVRVYAELLPHSGTESFWEHKNQGHMSRRQWR